VSTTSSLPRRSRWIVSAWWDLSYIVVTPLLIVPVVLILARRWLTPEQVSLAVIAFASLGHHLPGFMRAYGDQELFQRYRWRFLLVPVLVFGLALLFSPPQSLVTALRLPWTPRQDLHGLELILLVWGTWHGLMQTYGFMRIYDVRQGMNDRWTARLDHWLCLSVFIAGVVFSDARVFGIADTMWQSGLPLFGPAWIRWSRIAIGTISGFVLAAYLVNLLRLRRQGLPVSWIKLLLISSTGWFYWYTGRLSTNVLIGLAMFEIYHAVQYYAIVWIYNRRLFQRVGDRFGPLGFLFNDRWSMLGIYLATIAAYSSIRYFGVDANAYVFRGGSETAHQWLMAWLVTSSLLHFYFDGFIWKVSEKQTQQNLVEQLTHNTIAQRYVPGLLHASKWVVLLIVAAGLLWAEYRQPVQGGSRRRARLQALALLTPQLPECQSLLSRDALEHNHPRAAIQYAEQALTLRPRSHALHADLGLAHLQAKQLEQAEKYLRQALALAPAQWDYHTDLGLLLTQRGKIQQAEQALRQAIALRPDLLRPRQHLVAFYLQQGRSVAAAEQLQEIATRFPQSLTGELAQVQLLSQQGQHDQAVQLALFLSVGNPQNWRVQLALGTAISASGDPLAAIPPLKLATRLRPNSAEVFYHLGFAYFLSQSYEQAIKPLTRAAQLDPNHFQAHLQLANTYFALGDWERALTAYCRCQTLLPQEAELCAKHGGLLALLNRPQEAEAIYRSGLQAHADSAALHYNLGVLLWQQGQQQEARQLLLRAEKLGISIPTDVKAAITAKP